MRLLARKKGFLEDKAVVCRIPTQTPQSTWAWGQGGQSTPWPRDILVKRHKQFLNPSNLVAEMCFLSGNPGATMQISVLSSTCKNVFLMVFNTLQGADRILKSLGHDRKYSQPFKKIH